MLLLLVMGSVGVAFAADSTGTINVVAECTITSTELWDAAWVVDKNGAQLTVNTEYRINFTISDTDGMDDIVNANITIWDSATSTVGLADDQNDHYTFMWDGAVTGAWSCLGPDAGFYKGGSGSNSSLVTQYEFYLAFDLSKVAQYSNGGAPFDGWKITINATDTEPNTDEESECLNFGVSEYMETSGLAGTHAWNSLAPNSNNNALSDPVGKLSFTAIANRVWNATTYGSADPTDAPYSFGIGNITVYSADTVGSSVPLVNTPSKITIGTLGDTAVPNTEAGTACECWMWIDIPAGQQPGAYTYTLTILVEWAT